MSLHYTGDVSFRQLTPPAWDTQDAYEPDDCSLQYNGGALLEHAFLSTLATGQSLAYVEHDGTSRAYSAMFLVKAPSDGHQRQPKVTKHFIGFRSGTPKPPHPVDSLAEQSVTTTKTINNSASPLDGLTVTLTYRYFAARTQWTWYEITEPSVSTPAHTTTNDTTDPFDSTRFIGRTIGGAPGTTIPLADFVALVTTLQVIYRVGDYVRDPIIPGKLWHCSVCVDRVIVGA